MAKLSVLVLVILCISCTQEQTTTTEASTSDDNSLSTGAIIGISLGAVVLCCILTVIITCIIFKRKYDTSKSNEAETPTEEKTVILTLPDGRKISISAPSGKEAVNIVLNDFLDVNTNSQSTKPTQNRAATQSSKRHSKVISSLYQANSPYTSLVKDIRRGFKNPSDFGAEKTYETPAGKIRMSTITSNPKSVPDKTRRPTDSEKTFKKPAIPPKGIGRNKTHTSQEGTQRPTPKSAAKTETSGELKRVEGVSGVLPASALEEEHIHEPEERPEDDYDLINTADMIRI